MSEPVCQVEGCVNCSKSSSSVCEECDSGLMIAQDGSSCSALTMPPPPSFSTSSSMTTSTAASSGNNTGRLAGMYMIIICTKSNAVGFYGSHTAIYTLLECGKVNSRLPRKKVFYRLLIDE